MRAPYPQKRQPLVHHLWLTPLKTASPPRTTAPQPRGVDSPISRRDYVRLFYKALPASEYTEINSVADGAIRTSPWAASAREVYAFYGPVFWTAHWRTAPSFPESGIKRSEVAAIIVRCSTAPSATA